MKKQIGTLTVVALLVAAFVSGLSAADSNRLAVNVPFTFNVEGTSLPAGNYVLEIDRVSQGSATGSALVIRSRDNTVRHRFVTLPGASSGVKSGAQLVFNKYEGQYFLARVESYGLQANIRSSSLEKQIAARISRERETLRAAD